MGFGLTALAVDGVVTPEQVKEMASGCHRRDHPDGDLDSRIVAFYESLRRRFPDDGSLGHNSPWADEIYPGIDHIHMYLRFGHVSDPAIELIEELAALHHLVLYDPQGDEVHMPPGER